MLVLALPLSMQAAYAVCGLSGCAAIIYPAVAALKTNHVDPRQYGALQGALNAINDLAEGLGSPWFLWWIRFCSSPHASLGLRRAFPGLSWLLASSVLLLGWPCLLAV